MLVYLHVSGDRFIEVFPGGPPPDPNRAQSFQHICLLTDDIEAAVEHLNPADTDGLTAAPTLERIIRSVNEAEDAQLRERDRAERARLVALALPERAKAAPPAEGRPASPVTAALDQLELQRWLHAMNRDRHSYFGGDAWHECTLDAY